MGKSIILPSADFSVQHVIIIRWGWTGIICLTCGGNVEIPVNGSATTRCKVCETAYA